MKSPALRFCIPEIPANVGCQAIDQKAERVNTVYKYGGKQGKFVYAGVGLLRDPKVTCAACLLIITMFPLSC